MTPQFTISYGLNLTQSQSAQNIHILPITKILHPIYSNDYYLTAGRDGSIILHETVHHGKNLRLQVHSDWVSDLIELGPHMYVSVSHDFSIVLIRIFKVTDPLSNDWNWSWDMKIIGDHGDYIKCIVPLYSKPGIRMFATAGLDKTVKIWQVNENITAVDSENTIEEQTKADEDVSYKYDSDNINIGYGMPFPEVDLIHTFKNNDIQANESGSLYCMVSVKDISKYPFDLVVGDCNGDLIFYSCLNKEEIFRVKSAHSSNIKVIKLVENETKLLSTCSEGIIRVFNLGDVTDHPRYTPTKMLSLKWDCSIWCIEGNTLKNLIIGDSDGKIVRLSIINAKERNTTIIFDSKPYFKNKDQNAKENNNHKPRHYGILDMKLIQERNLYFSYCSDSNLNCLDLIEEKIKIKRGGFALTRSSLLTNRRHVITEDTEGKIQRWDIVSCELINTFDPQEGSFDDAVIKYTSKEILQHWCTVSVKVGMLFVKIGPKFLETEVYGSALESYQLANDVQLNPDERYNLGRIVANSIFNEFIRYEFRKDETFRKNLTGKKKDQSSHLQKDISKTPVSETTTNGNSEHIFKQKERNRKKSAFAKLGSSMTMGNLSRQESSNISAPTTPISANQNLTNELNNFSLADEMLVIPPVTAPANLHMENNSQNDNNEIVQPAPLLKSSSGRTGSSGSLLTRKFKSFRSNSAKLNSESPASDDGKKNETIFDDTALHDTLHAIAKDTQTENMTWEHPFKSDFGHNKVYQKAKSNGTSRLGSSTTLEQSYMESQVELSDKKEFMSDLISMNHHTYIQQYFSNSNSLKLLSKKIPESKFTKDPNCPIIQLKSETLVLVHCWKEGTCGGTVVFSTLLPPPVPIKDTDSKSSNDEENGSNETLDEMTESLLPNRAKGEQTLDLKSNEGKYQIFENLEKNLPFWFAQKIFQDVKIYDPSQPKLHFVILPWVDEKDAKDDERVTPAPQQFHHMFKIGRSKSNDNGLGSTDLPKISENNIKLTAPGMIKVKKIKLYVVDRFESKTPEMRAKADPNVWLELLCKGQVLDNDMTLSTVRTLYWKAQGEITIEYRRKVTNQSPLSKEL